ncbi:36508_t:CDS:2 [Gigaspora margarita]|uniref:36508_t:CDS:1 n=1 Tax=Gigaspora margarita TaxID=4874 RepID=A0ABN7V2W6_GIGMA|nr:36508_t:CDS:2 [Gigaspora margarita]
MEEWQCAITICPKVPCQRIKTVTDWVWERAQDNGTLPAYLQVSQEVCQRCYNGLMQSSVAMKEHTKATSNTQQLDANTLDPEANTREKRLNKLFDHQSTWKRYPLSYRDLKVIQVQENIPEEAQENITEEFISETNEDDDNVIIIGSNEDTVLDSLLQKLKELQQ